MPPFSRRLLLSGGAAALASLGAAACGTTPPDRSTTKPTTTTPHQTTKTKKPPNPESEYTTAGWILAENRRPGTDAWVVTSDPIPHSIEGYPDHVSATIGDKVALHVSSAASTFHVEAYRMGWYQGYFGRLVWKSGETRGSMRSIPGPSSQTKTIECNWPASLGFTVDADWPPGNYLLKLVGSNGQQKLMPFIVRDDSSTSAIVVQNSVTTRQAYNLWGEYSLYYGADGASQSYDNRSRVVSFDRPYGLASRDWADGAGDWLGNDFPFVTYAEKLGLDVTYWSDLDFAEPRPQLLTRHKLLVSLGHDEYWSTSMLDGALSARAAGVNFMFLGANACFRHIRVGNSPVGPNRQVICYKDPYEDPLYGVDNSEVTADWPSGPDPRPECALIGAMYQSNPVNASFVVSEPTAWGFAKTGATKGDTLPHVIGSEYDAYQPGLPGSPANLEIWSHSPLECRGEPGYADMTYYAQAGAGGVFATGTNWWVNKLSANAGKVPTGVVPGAIPHVTSALTQVTTNVIEVFSQGPAGQIRPSVPNWRAYYPPGSTSGPPGGVQGA